MMPAHSLTRPDPETGVCLQCNSLGIISVKDLHDGFQTLMRCECHEGEMQDYRLPKWEWKIGKIFSRKACPIDWFKPEAPITYAKIESITKTWRERVRWAEQYWAQGIAK